MDTDRFIIEIETKDFYKDITDDVKNWFHTSNYIADDKRPLLRGMMNKKVIGLMKDELGGQIILEFVAIRPKTYSYITVDNNEEMCNKKDI